MKLPNLSVGTTRLKYIFVKSTTESGITASRARKREIIISEEEDRLIRNLKPGQIARKTLTFAADPETASVSNCCPAGKYCCTWQCDPLPCVGNCTDEIIIR